MASIELLPENIQHQIAAGEVIERPASIVKELVENSIDAGSSKIEVRLWSGGIERMEIRDNGVGMSRQDAEKCFERYATSKLSSAEQLFSIETLGFRGEALASIAAVSEVVLQTKTVEDEVGTQVRVVGGKIEDVAPVASSKGTSIVVSRLFYNTPARKKYLHSGQTENRHSVQVVNDQALILPQIGFSLYSEHKTYYELPAGQDWVVRLGQVLGKNWSVDNLMSIDRVHGLYHIHGFLGKPSVARSSRSHQHLFVNGRRVDDYRIGYRIKNAMSTLIEKKAQPIFVLNIILPPEMVDVNVHPRKAEVKFVNPNDVYEAVENVVKEVLQKTNFLPQVQVMPKGIVGSNDLDSFLWGDVVVDSSVGQEDSQKDDVYLKQVEQELFGHGGWDKDQSSGWKMSQSPSAYNDSSSVSKNKFAFQEGSEVSSKWQSTTWNELPKKDIDQMSFSLDRRLKPLVQIYASYIVAQSAEGVVLVDQHAAQERVMYERLMNMAALDSNRDQQELLLPEHIEVGWQEVELVEKLQSLLEGWLIDIESFGPREFVVRKVPVFLAGRSIKPILEGLVDQLSQYGKVKEIDPELEKKLVMRACKMSLKAGESLDRQRMQVILDQLLACETPYTCPHGRPTMVELSLSFLEKMFHRK